MSKKQILISGFSIVALIITIAAIVISILPKQPAIAPTQSITMNSKAYRPIATDANYQLAQEQSLLRAQGKKPLISDYTDTAQIQFADGKLKVKDKKISGFFKVDLSSIEVESTGKKTGESALENHLKSPDFFDIEKYPYGTFELISAEKTDGNNFYTVNGNLTIKDTTKPISFEAEIFEQNGQLLAQGSVQLDRTRWGIKYGSGKFFSDIGDALIDDFFTVEFKIIMSATQ